LERSERPILRITAPKMTVSNVRKETGRPEKGTSIERAPRRMSAPVRDIENSIPEKGVSDEG
jgi:hypothetical protein